MTIEEARSLSTRDLANMSYSQLVEVDKTYRASARALIQRLEGHHMVDGRNSERIENVKKSILARELPSKKNAEKYFNSLTETQKRDEMNLVRREIGTLYNFRNLSTSHVAQLLAQDTETFDKLTEMEDKYVDYLKRTGQTDKLREYESHREEDFYGKDDEHNEIITPNTDARLGIKDFLTAYHEVMRKLNLREEETRFKYENFINRVAVNYFGWRNFNDNYITDTSGNSVSPLRNQDWRWLRYSEHEKEMMRALSKFKLGQAVISAYKQEKYSSASMDEKLDAYRRRLSGRLSEEDRKYFFIDLE